MKTRIAAGLIGSRYRIGGLLGEGGMARVFDAFDERLERRVAVKVLRAETRVLPGMRHRFQQEARIAAQLTHPHIVAVLDYGEDDAQSFLVMERLPGLTLRHEMSGGRLAPSRLLVVLTETLGALDAAHRFGVLHRDIKPSNILLQEDGHTKLTDFGIAKSLDDRAGSRSLADDLTMTGMVLGTPAYLAPERRAGHPATVQSDLYAVGAVLVEALTGTRADGCDPAQLRPPLRSIASTALAADPRQRFASATDFLQALRNGGLERNSVASGLLPNRPIAAGAPTVPTAGPRRGATAVLSAPPTRATPSRRGPRRRRVLTAVVCLGVLMAGLLAAFAVAKSPVKQPAPAANPRAQTTAVHDPVRRAITTLASGLAGGGLPGDPALALALDATAAQPPGAARTASAEQTLSLAQALIDGGGITAGQDQEVVSTLRATGATVPIAPTASTTTTTDTTPPVPQRPVHLGHDHRGDGFGGGGPGDQG